MQLICCQLDIVWENKAATHQRVTRLLDGATIRPGALVVLPEMFDTGFSLDVGRTAEDEARPSQRFLAATARRLGVFVLGGIVSRAGPDRGRNEAVVFDPQGNEVARYCKLHPFSFGQEDKHFEPGEHLAAFTWAGLTVAPFVCYDLRFPEVFRSAARRGAQVLAVIANWPAARQSHWLTLLEARAIENQAYVVGVNRCGEDPNHTYGGRSLVVDPRGQIVADAGPDECAVTADVDAGGLADYRKQFPALRDMRDEFIFNPPA